MLSQQRKSMAPTACMCSARGSSACHGRPCPAVYLILISPDGATAFSHGWISARCKRAERNPWKRWVADTPAPAGRRNRGHARRVCPTINASSSSGTPFAPPGRKEDKEETIFLRSAFHGLRVGPQSGRAAPPAATRRGPVGAEGRYSRRLAKRDTFRRCPLRKSIPTNPLLTKAKGKSAKVQRAISRPRQPREPPPETQRYCNGTPG